MPRNRRSRILICLFISHWLVGLVYGQVPGAVNAVPLRTLTQQRTTLNDYSSKLVAVVFLSPECPLCQQYTRTLNQLQKQYATELTILGIIPGKTYSSTECRAFQSLYGLTFTLLMDRPQQLSKALGATSTPEVFLINEQRMVLYAGAIDDWAVALGKMRPKASKHYLADAIQATLSGYPIALARTSAVGCLINDY